MTERALPRLTQASLPLSQSIDATDQHGQRLAVHVPVERALTIFLNSQEIVTAMTIGDYPDYLAIGYLLNQNMLRSDDTITAVDYDEDLAAVVVRTKRKTNYEKKLKKKVQTSGCAQGTVFGDLMEALELSGANTPLADLPLGWEASRLAATARELLAQRVLLLQPRPASAA